MSLSLLAEDKYQNNAIILYGVVTAENGKDHTRMDLSFVDWLSEQMKPHSSCPPALKAEKITNRVPACYEADDADGGGRQIKEEKISWSGHGATPKEAYKKCREECEEDETCIYFNFWTRQHVSKTNWQALLYFNPQSEQDLLQKQLLFWLLLEIVN